MASPQTGIFALGTLAHSYLELSASVGRDARDAIEAAASLTEPRTTMGGVNLVLGFRPELWRSLLPGRTPVDLTGFDAPVVGPDGYLMPATQRDIVVWISGGAYDIVFDAVIEVIAALDGAATVAEEIAGWTYHRDLDLTGFIDGSENPSLAEASRVALVPPGEPGAGGSVLLLQKWVHDAAAWSALSVEEQEHVIGRTKPASIELAERPESSHVARTDQDEFGHIFRRNAAYGSPSDHGTVFVGFSAARRPLAAMLESMAGVGGVRDALTRYARPLTGAYYFVPSLEDLAVAAASGG